MLWLLMAVLVVVGAIMAKRRTVVETEPWRQSLEVDGAEELDMEEIRQAEDEWLEEESWSDETDDEPWR